MNKSSFYIKEMDCPSEENLIRMKLDNIASIRQLSFDIPNRKLDVYHLSGAEEIMRALESLNLGAELRDTEEAIGEVIIAQTNERRVLQIVLLINFLFFIIEMSTGLISKSMGLVADSLDMLADTMVYALSLLVVGSTVVRKKKIAKIAGYFQMTLAGIGFIEVLRRFFGFEALPDFKVMIIVSLLALIANGICLFMLQRVRSKEAHIQASMIFTSNDVIINLGVIVAGIFVLYTKSVIPDLIIGSVVFLIVFKGAFRILSLSR